MMKILLRLGLPIFAYPRRDGAVILSKFRQRKGRKNRRNPDWLVCYMNSVEAIKRGKENKEFGLHPCLLLHHGSHELTETTTIHCSLSRIRGLRNLEVESRRNERVNMKSRLPNNVNPN